MDTVINTIIDDMVGRSVPEGGFAESLGGSYRPEPTAWGALALSIGESRTDLLKPSLERLAAEQLKDGRVCVSPEHPDAFWPTSLAILAWHLSPDFFSHEVRAANFLVNISGRHWIRKPDHPFAHDTSLKGWPWIKDTHSWVEPSSLALMALQVAGYSGHERISEGILMLLDRQLRLGGWNYGNTMVFGQELRPIPETTGMALSALAEQVSRGTVGVSLKYLRETVGSIRTPLTLGWSILGLSAWKERPPEAQKWIIECVEKQRNHGEYDTSLLSLLLVSYVAKGGLQDVFKW